MEKKKPNEIITGITFFAVFIFCPFMLHAQETVSTSVLPTAREQSALPPETLSTEIDQLLSKAEALLNAGQAAEVDRLLVEALEKTKGLENFQDTKRRVGELNTKILFSKRPGASGEMYEVVSGDTLGKIAKKYNTTVELIMRANDLKTTLIRPGDRLKVTKATYSIVVDKSDRTLTLFSDGKFFKQYDVAVGKSTSETPAGTFSIESKLENPTWFHAGAQVPPDSPDNILGTRWIGFSIPGYGVHGTTDPDSIGTASTAGCVRMRNDEVEELYSIVPQSIWVTVTE